MTNGWLVPLRRAAFALAVGMFTWGAGLAVVVFVPVLGHAGDLPEEFGVSEPHVGDSVVYRFEVVERSWRGSTVRVREDDAFHFTWLPPRIIADPMGTRIVNDVLYRARTFMLMNDVPTGFIGSIPESYRSNGTHLLLDPDDRHVVALQNFATLNHTYTLCCGPGAGSNVTEDRWLNSTAFQWVEDGPHRSLHRNDLCGYVHALQGEARPTDEEVVLFSGCDAAGTTIRGARFRADRPDRLGDEDCVVYRQTDGIERQRMSAWLCPSLPYPPRIEIAYVDFPAVIARYDIARFERGERAVANDSRFTPAPQPVEWAPRPPWVIDDSDMNHPFPLSAAYQIVENQSDEFHVFGEDHPGAVLAWAWFEEEVRDGVPERNWSLRWIGGDERLSVSVNRVGNESPKLWHQRSPNAFMNESEVRGALPSFVPTLRSLLASVETHADDGLRTRGVNAYGFSIEWMEIEDCTRTMRVIMETRPDVCQAELLLRVGHQRHTWISHGDGPPERAGVSDNLESQVTFDEAGRFQGSHESHIVGQHAPGPASGTRVSAGAGGGAMPAMMRVERPDWAPSREVVWTGAVAAALGALAYAWAHAKGLFAFGFFSRLERPQALAHPLRARLMDLIESDPGLPHNELVRRSELARPTASHHVRKLVELGLVVPQAANGRTCYYPAGRIDRRLMAALPFLRNPAARELVAAARRRPGLTAGEAAEAAGIHRATASYHVRRLKRAGLLSTRREGRELRIEGTPLAAEALRSMGENARTA